MIGLLAVVAAAAFGPVYLDAETVLDRVLASHDALAACVTAAPGPDLADARLGFTILPDGTAVGAKVAPSTGSDDVDACLVREAEALDFPRHDDLRVEVGVPIAIRGGALMRAPIVQLPPRDLQPLFLFTPPDMDPADRAAIQRSLTARPEPDPSSVPAE